MKITISLSKENVERLHQIKKESGIPISKLLEKSFEKSEFYEPNEN